MISAVAKVGLTRALVASPLGFLIGLSLGTLGGGGSILAVPALVYGAGEGAKVATTSSLVVVGTTSLIGMVDHLRAGRVRLWPGIGFGLVGIGGSFLGSALNKSIAPDVLLFAFSGLILVAAWRMWSRRNASERAVVTPANDASLVISEMEVVTATRSSEFEPALESDVEPRPNSSQQLAVTRSKAATVTRVLIAGSIVGFITGFFGVGGGFVIVPALVLALGYDMSYAVGTSLLVIAISSAEGLAFRLSSGSVDWRVVLPFTIAGVIGSVLGSHFSERVSPDRLTRWFVWLLIAVAIYTAVQSSMAL